MQEQGIWPRFWIQNIIVESVVCMHMTLSRYKFHLTKTWYARLCKTPFLPYNLIGSIQQMTNTLSLYK